MAFLAIELVGVQLTGADQIVAGLLTGELVAAEAAAQDIVEQIADDHVVTVSADGVLDVRLVGDGHVLGHAGDVAERARLQIEPDRVVSTGQVERVDAAAVPDGDHRLGVLGEVEDVAIRRGIEAIDGVAGPRRQVGAVDFLDRVDVVQQRGGRLRIMLGTGRYCREIRHDRVLSRILQILGVLRVVGEVVRIFGVGIVFAGMEEAERVADLVQEHLQRAAAERHVGILRKRRIDMNVAPVILARMVRLARERKLARIEEPDLTRLIDRRDEGDIGDVRPQVEHHLRHRPLVGAERAEAAVLVAGIGEREAVADHRAETGTRG